MLKVAQQPTCSTRCGQVDDPMKVMVQLLKVLRPECGTIGSSVEEAGVNLAEFCEPLLVDGLGCQGGCPPGYHPEQCVVVDDVFRR